MYHISNNNPTQMYLDSLKYLQNNGEKVVPRGKPILEVRPAVFEFSDPFNRITFLNSRRINPFFQLAESLWILSGESRVDWIKMFNSTIDQFSDDGVWFNAPYGERIRFWNKNSLHSVVINPIDQLSDAYIKLKTDPYTRQAVVVISNPMFDNSRYTIEEQGKDIACLTGDTIIASTLGDISIKDLVNSIENGLECQVYSYSESKQVIEIKQVISGALTRKNAEIIKITLKNGTALKMTPDHKVYIAKSVKNFDNKKNDIAALVMITCVVASNLHIGDRLCSFGYDENFLDTSDNNEITNISTLPDLEDVYDITVEDNHNFFANNYLVHNCNLCFTFKIRDNKLNMTVFNRSNDLHWGLFGANLCQFSTIQEVMLNWLRHSDVFELTNLKMGTYTHITDSLHIYTDDYGAKITKQVLESPQPFELNFNCACEPRMSLSYEQFGQFLEVFWKVINPYLADDDYLLDLETREKVFGKNGMVDSLYFSEHVLDEYWYFVIKSMVVYRLVKLNHSEKITSLMSSLENCQWKISMMYFLKSFIKKIEDSQIKENMLNWYKEEVNTISKSLLIPSEISKLQTYLSI